MTVSRFGISIEQDLLENLDEYVQENNFANRSQAIRQLISKNITERKWQCNNKVAGSITLTYSQHKYDVIKNIASIQETYFEEVLSSQRIILSKEKSMEIIAVKGIASRLTELSDKLISIKGIDQGKLTMSRID